MKTTETKATLNTHYVKLLRKVCNNVKLLRGLVLKTDL